MLDLATLNRIEGHSALAAEHRALTAAAGRSQHGSPAQRAKEEFEASVMRNFPAEAVRAAAEAEAGTRAKASLAVRRARGAPPPAADPVPVLAEGGGE